MQCRLFNKRSGDCIILLPGIVEILCCSWFYKLKMCWCMDKGQYTHLPAQTLTFKIPSKILADFFLFEFGFCFLMIMHCTYQEATSPNIPIDAHLSYGYLAVMYHIQYNLVMVSPQKTKRGYTQTHHIAEAYIMDPMKLKRYGHHYLFFENKCCIYGWLVFT